MLLFQYVIPASLYLSNIGRALLVPLGGRKKLQAETSHFTTLSNSE